MSCALFDGAAQGSSDVVKVLVGPVLVVVPLVHGGVFAVQEVDDLSGKLVDRDVGLRPHLQDSLEDVRDGRVAGKLGSNLVEGEGIVCGDNSVGIWDSAESIGEMYQAVGGLMPANDH